MIGKICHVTGAVVLVAAMLAAGCALGPPAATSLRIAYPYEMVTVDPHAHVDMVTEAVLAAVYEGLVHFEPGLQVQPWLADSWTTPDDTTWVLHIREGVRFHDGTMLEPADVVASISRARASKVMGHQLEDIDQLRVVDEVARTVEITTARPAPLLLTRLEAVAVAPRGFDPADPIGTGPYQWRTGSIQGPIQLRRWDGYWRGAPDFEEVTIQFATILEEMADLLHENELDVVASVTVSYFRDHEPQDDWRLVASPAVIATYLGLNVTESPLDDLRVRKAIDLAINRRHLVADIFPEGTARAARSLVPPEIFGYSPAHRRHDADPVRAREVLAEVGLPAGTTLHLNYIERNAEVAESISDSLNAVGLETETRAVSIDEFYRGLDERTNQLFLFSWTFGVADASPFLDTIVHSRDLERGLGSFNGAGLSEPDLDALIGEAAHEPRSAIRLERLQQTLAMLEAIAVYLPLYQPSTLALVHDNFVLEAFAGSVIRPQDVRRVYGR
jgi:peptide/nickel transport system substrate-binding protein